MGAWGGVVNQFRFGIFGSLAGLFSLFACFLFGFDSIRRDELSVAVVNLYDIRKNVAVKRAELLDEVIELLVSGSSQVEALCRPGRRICGVSSGAGPW